MAKERSPEPAPSPGESRERNDEATHAAAALWPGGGEPYWNLFQAVNDGVCLHEVVFKAQTPVDYRILDINPKYETLTGITRLTAVGALASRLYGCDPPPYLDLYSQVARTGEPVTFEDYFAPLDKHFLISVCALGPGRFATVFQDVTHLKKVEEALRESEERFRTLYYTTPDAVNVNRLDDGLYVDINQGFTRITGYLREEVIGKTSIELGIWKVPADRLKLVEELRGHGFCDRLETEFVMKGGRTIYGAMSAKVISFQGVPHIISITRDITVQTRLAQDKERLIGELKTALSEVKALQGLIPICANCKKVRDDQGYWNQIEAYISAHSAAQFTHGICPDCVKILYPELGK
ncbi:MAG: PAS domain S-box protein [Deltaproteobacteria bacterium]|nr:PAS domain S-box protein [Deltaproteobacteria bacterium]